MKAGLTTLAARTKASIDQIANYLPPVLLPLLVKEYE